MLLGSRELSRELVAFQRLGAVVTAVDRNADAGPRRRRPELCRGVARAGGMSAPGSVCAPVFVSIANSLAIYIMTSGLHHDFRRDRLGSLSSRSKPPMLANTPRRHLDS